MNGVPTIGSQPTAGGRILIVGGTHGIGREYSALAVAQGKEIYVASRTGSVDVTNEETTKAYVNDITTNFGQLTGVVLFQRWRGAQWDGHLDTSLTGTKNVIEACRNIRDISIVIVTSSASRFVADEQYAGYHAAKAGLLGLMRFYAQQLGQFGIRVNAVAPGTVIKRENKSYFENEGSKLRVAYEKVTPLGRMGTALEVCKVISFLLSSDASFITGQEIMVDGGVSLNWQESLAKRYMMI
jgi:NAD(P)-dependent dehydrogenase (short-subunit alcohol dehydrogenase family)